MASVVYERIGHVAVVTISRPQRRNAVDRETAEALSEAWQTFEEDHEALVGILTGAGGTFCSGADLHTFDLIESAGGWLGMTRTAVTKPTIAAIAGHCVAGGLELALWCDLRVAGEDAVFGCFERRFGVPLVDGGTQRLPRVVGLGRALDMILTGRSVSAHEAHRIGLVDRLVPADTELDAAFDLARQIASHPQATVRSDRAAVYAGLGVELAEGIVREAEIGRQVLDIAADGARRFREGDRRPPYESTSETDPGE